MSFVVGICTLNYFLFFLKIEGSQLRTLRTLVSAPAVEGLLCHQVSISSSSKSYILDKTTI